MSYDSWKATHLADWRDDPADDDYPDTEEDMGELKTFKDLYAAVLAHLGGEKTIAVACEVFRHADGELKFEWRIWDGVCWHYGASPMLVFGAMVEQPKVAIENVNPEEI